MFSAAWSALADRFSALAAEGEFTFQVFPRDDGGAFWLPDHPFVYRFSGDLRQPDEWGGPAAVPGGLPLHAFARLNRLRWLSWAAGLLLGGADHHPPEVVWWRKVWITCEHAVEASDADGRRVLRQLAARSADLARLLEGVEPPATPAGWLPATPGRWPEVQRSLRLLLPRLRERPWEDEHLELALQAFAEPGDFSAWCQEYSRPPLMQAHRAWAASGGVRGDPDAVAAFVRLAETAAPLLPAELRLDQPLLPDCRAIANAQDGGVRNWFTAMYLAHPGSFVLHFDGHPPAAAPGATVRGSPVAVAAATVERLIGWTAREAVATFHQNCVGVNPWLTPAEADAAFLAVAAAHARDAQPDAPAPAAAPAGAGVGTPPDGGERVGVTLGDAIQRLDGFERSRRQIDADQDDSIGSGHRRMQAAADLTFAFQELRAAPGFARVEALVNAEYGPLTAAALTRLRGVLCRRLDCGADAADRMSLAAVADALGAPGSVGAADSRTVQAETPPADVPGGADQPVTVADLLDMLRHRRETADFLARQRAEHLARPLTLDSIHYHTHWAALNAPRPCRLTEEQAATIPVYRRLVREARASYHCELDDQTLRMIVADLADRAERTLDEMLASGASEFARLWDANPASSRPVHDEVTGRAGPRELVPVATAAESQGADPLAGLPASRRSAWSSHQDAVRREPALANATDRQVYDWLVEKGETVPTQFETWAKYLRECRQTLGLQKNTPRAGRADGSRSITRTP